MRVIFAKVRITGVYHTNHSESQWKIDKSSILFFLVFVSMFAKCRIHHETTHDNRIHQQHLHAIFDKPKQISLYLSSLQFVHFHGNNSVSGLYLDLSIASYFLQSKALKRRSVNQKLWVHIAPDIKHYFSRPNSPEAQPTKFEMNLWSSNITSKWCC